MRAEESSFGRTECSGVGLPAAVLTAVFIQAADGGLSWSSFGSPDFWVRLVAALLILAPVGGYAWGAIMWWEIQKRKNCNSE
jgi:hypothetical protein